MIKENICVSAFENLYYLYLSEETDAHDLMTKYIKLGFKMGAIVEGYRTEKDIDTVMKICRKVRLEKHRFLGFIRFIKTKKELYYAKFEPDHNILPLITPHFANRFKDEYFMIHDLKRNIAAVYNKSKWMITDMPNEVEFLLIEEEADYERLWKIFYESVFIKSRKNLKQQKGYMPTRYWKHLTEKKTL